MKEEVFDEDKALECHDLAKQLSHYLYFFFFSFLFLLSWIYYTKGSTGKCYVTSVTQSQSHHMMSHDKSHDRHGKEVHRPCSSYISSVEKSNENSIEFSLLNADKGAVGLILALKLASLTLRAR